MDSEDLIVPFTPLIEFFGTYKMFKILIQPDVGTSYLSKILLLYGAITNKTLVSLTSYVDRVSCP